MTATSGYFWQNNGFGLKNILAFGDSLTWGSCPQSGGRHDLKDRWPVALSEGLSDVQLISEGLRGRTTAFARPTAGAEMSGVVTLPMLLHSHAPLDLVIIMLGTNDIYEGYQLYQIRDGLARLIEQVRHHPWRLPEACAPKILLVSPPPVTMAEGTDVTYEKVIRSEALPEVVQLLASNNDCAFFDAASVGRIAGGWLSSRSGGLACSGYRVAPRGRAVT